MASKPTLLVADDEIEIGEIVKAVAKGLGFEVTCVAEGSEVVDIVDRIKPDVIALDLRMPGADGVEIIRELGKRQCKSGFLLMSGMDQRMLSSVQSLGKESNLDIAATLTKPMSLDAIESALAAYLAKPDVRGPEKAATEARIPFEFGLEVLYQPELQIKPLAGAPEQRLRVHAQWRKDDSRLIDALELTALTRECGISKGLSKMILAQALENLRVWSNQDFKPELSIQFDESCLSDLSTPDALAMMADRYHVPRERLAIEINERSILNKQDTVGDVLSRLRIKGFKIVVAAEGEGENLLPLMDSLPMDQVVIDLSCLNARANYHNDMEVEFMYSSLTSTTNKKGLAACADNVNSAQMLEFAKKCNFNGARGAEILQPTRANEILALHRRGETANPDETTQSSENR